MKLVGILKDCLRFLARHPVFSVAFYVVSLVPFESNFHLVYAILYIVYMRVNTVKVPVAFFSQWRFEA